MIRRSLEEVDLTQSILRRYGPHMPDRCILRHPLVNHKAKVLLSILIAILLVKDSISNDIGMYPGSDERVTYESQSRDEMMHFDRIKHDKGNKNEYAIQYNSGGDVVNSVFSCSDQNLLCLRGGDFVISLPREGIHDGMEFSNEFMYGKVLSCTQGKNGASSKCYVISRYKSIKYVDLHREECIPNGDCDIISDILTVSAHFIYEINVGILSFQFYKYEDEQNHGSDLENKLRSNVGILGPGFM